jgi:multidrug efflux system outer membrane protein
LFPDFLSGLLGLNAEHFRNLGKSESGVHSLGVGLAWTPFDFGAICSRIASEASSSEQSGNLRANRGYSLEETEGACSYTRSAQRAGLLQTAAINAGEAGRLYSVRCRVIDFWWCTQKREVLVNQDLLVQSQADTATSLVSVYRAIGGGWDQSVRVCRPLASF